MKFGSLRESFKTFGIFSLPTIKSPITSKFLTLLSYNFLYNPAQDSQLKLILHKEIKPVITVHKYIVVAVDSRFPWSISSRKRILGLTCGYPHAATATESSAQGRGRGRAPKHRCPLIFTRHCKTEQRSWLRRCPAYLAVQPCHHVETCNT